MELIAKHIEKLEVKIHDFHTLTLCAMTGKVITEGCLKKDVIGVNFTDKAYLRYPSPYVSVAVAKCILGRVGNDNGLRNYSFYATDTALTLLKREDIMSLIFSEKATPFILGVTFSNKKHISFKGTPQYDSNLFRIYTDVNECVCDIEKVRPLVAVMQKWYTVLPEKRNTEAQPTYFTKANISGETSPNHTQIQAYGEDQYFTDIETLSKSRNTLIFKVLLHVLNKIQ
jgi:hypothetical protein